MMKTSLRLVTGLFAMLVCMAAHASAIYQFSYTDNANHQISGQFTGTANGNLITGLSAISVKVDNVAFAGSGNLFTASFNYGAGAFQSGGAVVSIDGLQNNFFFSDVNFPAQTNLNNYLFSVAGLADSLFLPAVGANGTAGKNNWSLTATDVPEPASLALLGLGLVAVVCTRRKA